MYLPKLLTLATIWWNGSLSASGAVLAIISTILGGGIVGLPYSIYSTGIYCGVLIAMFAAG